MRGEGGIEENVVTPAGTLSYSFIEFHIFAIFLFISLLVPPLSPVLSTVSSVHTAPVQLRLDPNLPIERRDAVRSIYPPSPELVRLNQFYWPNDHGLYGYELGRILFPYPQCLSRMSSEDDFVYGRRILMYRSWIERFTLRAEAVWRRKMKKMGMTRMEQEKVLGEFLLFVPFYFFLIFFLIF